MDEAGGEKGQDASPVPATGRRGGGRNRRGAFGGWERRTSFPERFRLRGLRTSRGHPRGRQVCPGARPWHPEVVRR